MATALRAIRGLPFIRSVLRRIELVIKFAMYDIEEGFEVLIPPDLSQNKLPWSFRYYDPICAIMKNNVSDRILSNFKIQNNIGYQIHT